MGSASVMSREFPFLTGTKECRGENSHQRQRCVHCGGAVVSVGSRDAATLYSCGSECCSQSRFGEVAAGPTTVALPHCQLGTGVRPAPCCRAHGPVLAGLAAQRCHCPPGTAGPSNLWDGLREGKSPQRCGQEHGHEPSEPPGGRISAVLAVPPCRALHPRCRSRGAATQSPVPQSGGCPQGRGERISAKQPLEVIDPLARNAGALVPIVAAAAGVPFCPRHKGETLLREQNLRSPRRALGARFDPGSVCSQWDHSPPAPGRGAGRN